MKIEYFFVYLLYAFYYVIQTNINILYKYEINLSHTIYILELKSKAYYWDLYTQEILVWFKKKKTINNSLTETIRKSYIIIVRTNSINNRLIQILFVGL